MRLIILTQQIHLISSQREFFIKKKDNKKEKRLQRRRERKRLKKLRNPPSGHKRVNIYENVCNSRILDFYIENAGIKDSIATNKITFPSIFSFIENPNDTLEAIEIVVASIQHNIDNTLHFDQSEIEKLDFCAEAVTTALAKEAKYRMRVSLEGTYPKESELKEILAATGLPREVGAKLPYYNNQYLHFPLRKGRKEVTYVHSLSEKRDILASGYLDYVNKCFRLHGFELNEKGTEYLISILTEILENAENHSGKKDWWLSGYMRVTENNDYSDCHLALFNFGDSIYDSLQKLPDDALLRKELDKLSNKHIGILKSWTKEQLWTLYALQSGVSRNNADAKEMSHNGRGTVDIINFFQSLGKSGVEEIQPKMCLISGNTYILHDNKYKMEEVSSKGGEKRMRIAFNEDNDLNNPPDKNNLRKLNYRFPGTLFSFRFYLSRDYMYSIAKNGS